MSMIYRKQPVTVVREAKEGDVGFDEDVEIKQVLIKHADGSQTAVPEDQVTDDTHHHKTEVHYKTEVDHPKTAPKHPEPVPVSKHSEHQEHRKPVR